MTEQDVKRLAERAIKALERIADALPYPKATTQQKADKQFANDESPRPGAERDGDGPRGGEHG